MNAIRFSEVFDLTSLPANWSLQRLSFNWVGEPLLLIAEGRPRRPLQSEGREAWDHWASYKPTARRVIYWRDGIEHSLRFENSDANLIYHVQQFEDGWLLGETRGGRACLFNGEGKLRGMLDLGDAINDIQTTPNGQIWVSYFDEGVFGLGIGRSGVVCFNSDGTQAFKFDELSQAEGLPFIDDCYGMNVTKDGDVWLNYYSDFPLIHLRRGLVERVWENFGSMGSAFAIHDRHVLYLQDGSLISRDLDNPELIEPIKLHDDEGKELFPTEIEGLQAAGRGEHFVVSTSSGVYKLCR